MKTIGRTATEASGITALAVGVSFIVSGAYIPGFFALAIGVALIGVYEFAGIGGIELSEDQIEVLSETAGETTEEAVEEYTGK